jgi:hypothetical protein
MISAASGDNKMTYDEFITYPAQVGPYKLNTPRNLQFSSNCFFKSPNEPIDCAPGECITNVAIPELNNTTWGELALNECSSYYPDSSIEIGLGAAPEGNILVSVISKCQNMTWTSDSIYVLTDEWSNVYIMHASGSNTAESLEEAVANVALPEGWSVESVNITEPLTIYPRMVEDGSCYYTIVRDSQDNSYHEVGCGGSVQPTDFNLSCPADTMSEEGKAKKAAAGDSPSPAPAPVPAPSSASRVANVAGVVAATLVMAAGF